MHSNKLRSYVKTALWSSTGDDDAPLDENYSIEDIDPESLDRMNTDVEAFFDENEAYLVGEDEGRVAHDFWLTRNGHGAGFWDGDYPEHGDALTASAERYGEQSLYEGDDGKLYVDPLYGLGGGCPVPAGGGLLFNELATEELVQARQPKSSMTAVYALLGAAAVGGIGYALYSVYTTPDDTKRRMQPPRPSEPGKRPKKEAAPPEKQSAPPSVPPSVPASVPPSSAPPSVPPSVPTPSVPPSSAPPSVPPSVPPPPSSKSGPDIGATIATVTKTADSVAKALGAQDGIAGALSGVTGALGKIF